MTYVVSTSITGGYEISTIDGLGRERFRRTTDTLWGAKLWIRNHKRRMARLNAFKPKEVYREET